MVAASPETDGQVYNLGAFIRKKGKYVEVADNIKTVGEIAHLITEMAEKGTCTIIPYPEDRKSIEVGHFYSDATKIYEAVGWEPKVSLSDGIRRTIEFYRRNKQDYWK